MVTKWAGSGRRINQEFGINGYTDKQQGPTVQLREQHSISVITYNEKESEKEYLYIKSESICPIPEINTTLQISYASIKEKKAVTGTSIQSIGILNFCIALHGNMCISPSTHTRPQKGKWPAMVKGCSLRIFHLLSHYFSWLLLNPGGDECFSQHTGSV